MNKWKHTKNKTKPKHIDKSNAKTRYSFFN